MRPRKKEASGSLDSLLDTMTNVVGILVILLAVTQMGVAQALERIRTNLPDISPEQLAQAQKEVRELAEILKQLQQTASKPEEVAPLSPLELKKLKEQIAKLQKYLDENPLPKIDVEKTKKLLAQLKDKLQKLEKQIELSQDELARLKAMLEKTPKQFGPPAKIIRLPDPRQAPKKAKPIYVLCVDNRIYPCNLEDLKKRGCRKILSMKKFFLYREKSTRPGRSGKLTKEYDYKKISGFFDKNFVGDRDFRIVPYISGYRLGFHLVPRKQGGEGLKQIEKRNNRFRALARKAVKQNRYARFFVWNDSFPIYVEARKVADECKFPAGWQPHSGEKRWSVYPGQTFPLHGYSHKKPKPRKPSAKPSKPQRPRPPDVID